MDFASAEKYIGEIPKFIKKNTPEDTRAFFSYLDLENGLQGISVIHVAGTNGKGSVCAYLKSVLETAGYSTGMFISPHLVTVRERMRLGDTLISEEEFEMVFDLLTGALEDYNEETGKEYHPSFFEWLFFMAMIWFAEMRPEFVLLETGLGGRLDATNTVPAPVLSIITRIGFDHTDLLGETLPEIAGEKAGIIKKNVPVVYLWGEDDASEVIRDRAVSQGTLAYPVYADTITAVSEGRFVAFSAPGRYYEGGMLRLNTPALYQPENAALAVRAAEVLTDLGLAEISREALEKGLFSAHWEARFETLMPGFVIDGAHNEDGCKMFLRSVQTMLRKAESGETEKGILLFSALRDKSYEAMARRMDQSGLFEKVLIVPIDSYRAASAEILAGLFSETEKTVYPTLSEGLREAVRLAQNGKSVFAAGSLYLAGEIKSIYDQL